ncbi:helix-turn-helix domain-containing protein [Kitasatospora sp. NBC_01302]|uniref:helix-turn-helix domain-containing protein n=1 Tax=Kitasatospora sp. NBC_01302 TaxID=2903575 RepID=UPI002E0F5892|nr:hypothetical protein OG294_27755 [Kitasatospora sp. NBC_01302]
MTAPAQPPARDDRPAPTVFHSGIIVPAELCAELAGALDLLAAYLRGTPPPASCRAPRLSRAAQGVLQAARDAAVLHRRRETARAALATPTPPVLPPAQPPAASTQMVTTAVAAEAVGVSPEWIRRAAAEGRIRAEQAPRNTWLVDLDDVRAWRAGRTRRSHGGHPERTAEPGAA